MGIERVKASDVAAIVTTLEMKARPAFRVTPPCPLRLKRWHKPAVAHYRALFTRVGAPWLWFSRLLMDDVKLAAVIHDDEEEIFVVLDPQAIEVGILELDFSVPGECELAYFGLVPELTGRGYGRWLMAQALNLAWQKTVNRVWVHTCTLDHPSALGFYRRSGFEPFERSIETFPDPRLMGILPRDCAPHIALFSPPSS